MGFISPKNPKGQQEAGAGGNHTDERGSDHNLPDAAACRKRHQEHRGPGSDGAENADYDDLEHRNVFADDTKPPRPAGSIGQLLGSGRGLRKAAFQLVQ